ncbi:MAG: hypothetical protein FWE24_07665 [Defluviitaleaceae bacterium]|nr:hypothetical protein [Defluviitaleaceae bacterium]
MNEFEIKMDILISSLGEKNEILNLILNITENQEQLIDMDKSEEMWDMFVEMNEAKQEHIDRVVELDNIFQGVFEGISDNFEDKAREIPEKTANLQALINASLELDVKIRATEQRNRAELSKFKKTAPARVVANTSKAELLKRYEQNKKKQQ